MMVARALDVYVGAVDQEALGRAICNGPNAKRRLVRVDDGAAHRQRGHRNIQIWLLAGRRSPELWTGDGGGSVH